MKHFSTILAGAFCCLCLLNSCSDDYELETTVPEVGNNNSAEYSFVVKNFIREAAANSRTAIELPNNDTDGAGFTWTANDTIGIAPNEGAQAYFVINESGAGSNTASFSGGAWALKPDESSNYAAYYPFIGDIYLDRTKVPVDYRGQVYRPAEEGKLTSLASHDIMAAKPSQATNSGNVAFDFNHLGALVEVQFTPTQTGNITEVALVAQTAVLPYRGSFDLTAETIAITYEDKDKTNTLSVAVEDMSVTQGEATSVFFMMPPVDLREQTLYLRVTYRGSEAMLYPISEQKNMEAGKWYTYSVDDEAVAIPDALQIEDNSTFKDALSNALGSATRIKFVTNSSKTSETILAEDGDLKAYAILNGEWLEVHTSAFRVVASASANEMFFYFNTITELDLTGFDTSKVTNMSNMFAHCTALTSLDVSKFITANVTDMSYMFAHCTALTSLDVSNFNTANVTDMSYMFAGCEALTSLDVSKFITANVTNMSNMFSVCKALTSLDVSKFNTAAVTDMSDMFSNCTDLTSLDLSNFNTANVTDMGLMFAYCFALTELDVSNFNTAKVTNMSDMFANCEALTELDLRSFTFNATTYSNMFSYTGSSAATKPIPIYVKDSADSETLEGGSTGIDSSYATIVAPCELPGYDENSDTNAFNSAITSFLSSNTSLTKIAFIANSTTTSDNQIGTSGAYMVAGSDNETLEIHTAAREFIFPANCSLMFYGYYTNLTTITAIDFNDCINTANVTNMTSMFRYCNALTELTLGDNFDTSNVTNMNSMFRDCTALTELTLGDNFDTSNVKDMSNMFRNCKALTSLTLGNSFNTAAVTDMSHMFRECKALTSLNLSNFNTEKVTTMYNMFRDCTALTSLDLSNFITANVTNMSYMFAGCEALTSLDLSNFNTANVKDMSFMFAHCYALTSLNVTNFNTEKVTNMSCMFRECKALTSLDLCSFTFNATTYSNMFNNTGSSASNLTIYVKDETDKTTLEGGSTGIDSSYARIVVNE